MNIDKIVEAMVVQLGNIRSGTWCTAVALAKKADHSLDENNLQEIEARFRIRAEEAGFFLDYSPHYRKDVPLARKDFAVWNLKPEKEFDKVSWTVCKEYDFADVFEIDLQNSEIIYRNTEQNPAEQKYSCNMEQWQEILQLVKDCKFGQWNAVYGNTSGMYNKRWKIELKKLGDTVYEIRGDHCVPQMWRIFDILYQKCKSLLQLEELSCPDPQKYKFIQNTVIAGIFASPDKKIFSYITRGERVKLIREPDNPYDKNAIRVEIAFSEGSKIGYIPAKLAVLWAPCIDSGRVFTGWINVFEEVMEKGDIDVYEEIDPEDSNAGADYAEITLPREELVYRNNLDKITGIYFKFSALGCCYFSMYISFTGYRILFKEKVRKNKGTYVRKYINFTKEQWKKEIFPRLEECDFLTWEGPFWDPFDQNSIDNGLWEMIIWKNNRKKKRFFVDDDYSNPHQWDIWLDFVFDHL